MVNSGQTDINIMISGFHKAMVYYTMINLLSAHTWHYGQYSPLMSAHTIIITASLQIFSVNYLWLMAATN